MNFKGKDCVIDVARRLAEWMNAYMVDNIPASEDMSMFVAPSSSFTWRVVSGRHLLYWRSRHFSWSAYFMEIPNFQKLLGGTEHVQTVYQVLFFPPTHESLGTRLTWAMPSRENSKRVGGTNTNPPLAPPLNQNFLMTCF